MEAPERIDELSHELKATRTREAAREFDVWFESVRTRLATMASEVGDDTALRKILGMLLLWQASELLKTTETIH
jgi:hypothetical protein